VVRKRFSGSQISCLRAILCIVATAAVALYAGKAPRAAAPDAKQLKTTIDRLDSIKKEIETRRKKIRELEKAEGNYLARLEFLESNITASRKYLSLLEIRIDTAESTIIRLTDSVQTAESRLSGRQEIMKRRLRLAYMTGTSSPFAVFFMAQNPLDLINRVRYLEGVHRYDRELAQQIDSARKHLSVKKRSFESERRRLAGLLADKKTEQVMLVKEEASRKNLLEDVRSKKKSNQAMIAELEAAQQELNETIRFLQEKSKKGGKKAVPHGKSGFARNKGALPWPIQGEVVARFGRIVHPLYQTITMNNGIDIRSSSGGPVRCVADGAVIYTGSMRGLGRIVIVDHGSGYFSIYARLETIATVTGTKIFAGSSLGSIGGGGEVHFEIRLSTESLDPYLWLTNQ
jgi:murein hydrolase activator